MTSVTPVTWEWASSLALLKIGAGATAGHQKQQQVLGKRAKTTWETPLQTLAFTAPR